MIPDTVYGKNASASEALLELQSPNAAKVPLGFAHQTSTAGLLGHLGSKKTQN